MVELIGYIGALGTTICLMPQVCKTLKTRSTKDLSLISYLILTVDCIVWLIYATLIGSIPVILSNGITLLFSIILVVLIIKDKR